MERGYRNEYNWFQLSEANFNIDDFRRKFESYLLGKYICVTTFDSGPLTISPQEKKEGWKTLHGIAISPGLKSNTNIPTAGFDEWYIFDSVPMKLVIEEKFVNYFNLDLSEDSDDVTRFWTEVEKHKPYIYLSDGTRLTIVSSDNELARQIESHWR